MVSISTPREFIVKITVPEEYLTDFFGGRRVLRQ